jgi:hypothetical protein
VKASGIYQDQFPSAWVPDRKGERRRNDGRGVVADRRRYSLVLLQLAQREDRAFLDFGSGIISDGLGDGARSEALPHLAVEGFSPEDSAKVRWRETGIPRRLRARSRSMEQFTAMRVTQV